jgi:hypothetical protein
MNLPKMLDMFTTRAGLLPSFPESDRLFLPVNWNRKRVFSEILCLF